MSTTTITRPAHAKPAATAEGVSFSLGLDQASYVWTAASPRTLTATLILRCSSAAPLTLSFAGGQEFDIAIRDAAGRQVALWSGGQAFFDHVQTITVSGERRWTATMALPEPSLGTPPRPGGAPFAPAAYTATGYLTPAGEATGSLNVNQGGTASASSGHSMQPDMAIPLPIQPPVAFPPATAPRVYSATVGFVLHADPVVLDQAPNASA